MKKKAEPLCVYNRTRECFLALRVAAADTPWTRIRGLIGRWRLRSDEGIWVVPSNGVHTLGVLFPLDLIYLDENEVVLELREMFPRFRIGPLRMRAASVLELPRYSIYASQTQKGDQLLICPPAKMEARLQTLSINPGELAFLEATCRDGTDGRR